MLFMILWISNASVAASFPSIHPIGWMSDHHLLWAEFLNTDFIGHSQVEVCQLYHTCLHYNDQRDCERYVDRVLEAYQ